MSSASENGSRQPDIKLGENIFSICRERQGLKKRRACCTSATDCSQANRRVWNVIRTELFRTNKEVRIKEVTGLIYISVRPNLLRPFNACGMVQRNSSILNDRHQCGICRDYQRNSLTLALYIDKIACAYLTILLVSYTLIGNL